MSELKIKPAGHYLLIEMVEVKNVSVGGIILGDTGKEQSATEIGVVRGIGPVAFVGVNGCNPESYPTGSEQYKMTPAQLWGVDMGVTVQYARFEGQTIKLKGYENYRYIPDMTVKGVIEGEVELTKASY